MLNPIKWPTIISKPSVLFFLIVLYMAASTPFALAHSVLLSAYVEGDMVFVEGGYSDGTLCKHATIEVFDSSGKMILEGKTDENGEFSFKPPQKIDLKIVLNAGMGHRDEYAMSDDELPDISGMQNPKAEPAPPVAGETGNPQASLAAARIDPKEVESIVDRVIQKRLRPLTQLVAKSQRNAGVSATEIFGGIGYIVGLMGIAMYFKSRKGGKV
jgi:nickel transport protein